jgi:hypothetical protein
LKYSNDAVIPTGAQRSGEISRHLAELAIFINTWFEGSFDFVPVAAATSTPLRMTLLRER